MFEAHKEKKAEEARKEAAAQAQGAFQSALALWGHKLDGLNTLLALAEGNNDYEGGLLMLKKEERCLLQVQEVGLVEERRGPGQWQGSSQGVSFPIGKIGGRSIRYRVGSTRGHMIPGETKPTMIDKGTMSITNQRIVFQGSAKNSECAFTKLLGIQHSAGAITISVSSRQKPTVLYFGTALDDTVSDRLGIAIGLFHGDEEEIKKNLQDQISELQAAKPTQE